MSSPDSPAHDDTLADDVLVARIRAGDVQAFEELFRRYYAMLCDVAAVLVRSYDSAEEIVADVLARVWERRSQWEPAGGPRPYLILAVRNRALNAVRDAAGRRQKVQGNVLDDYVPGMGVPPVTPDVAAEAESVATLLWETINTLPEATQLTLTLRWKHGLSWDEVAQAVGSSPIAVQMQYARARKVLRTRLARFIE